MFGLVSGPGRRLSQRASLGLRGMIYVGVLLTFVLLLILNFQGVFAGQIPVKAQMISIGDGMQAGAEVKFRSLTVGEVKQVAVEGDIITADLLIDKDKIGNIPGNVTARVVPTTLFGNAQVALVEADTRGAPLQRNDQVAANTEGDTFELQDALNEFRRLVNAAPPAQLDATLSALGESIEGRGAKLGATAQRLDAYLAANEPHIGTWQADLQSLGSALQTFSAATPDLIGSMQNLRTTIRTFNDKQPEWQALLAGTPVFARDVNTWLQANDENIIRVIKNTRPFIGTMRKEQANIGKAIPLVNTTLDEGATLLEKHEGAGAPLSGFYGGFFLEGYEAPADCPRYPGLPGPNCSGGSARPATESLDFRGNVGYVGSAAELQALVAAYGISGQEADTDVAALYLAPMLRGRTVVAP